MTEEAVKQQDTPEEESLLFDLDERGRFLALLPSGKRPVIKAMLPGTLRNIYAAFKQPEPPVQLLPVPGTGMAQKLRDERDPAYREALDDWWRKTRHALLTRIITDCLVVPEDADFSIRDEGYIAHPTCQQHRTLGSEAKWKRMGLKGDPSDQCTCIKVPAEDDWSIDRKSVV